MVNDSFTYDAPPSSYNISVLITVGVVLIVLTLVAHRNRHPKSLADEGPDGLASLVLPLVKLQKYQNRPTRTFESFFDSLLPIEYKIGSFDLFWLKLRLEHDWSGLSTRYFKYQTTVVDKWFLMASKLLTYLLVNTVLNILFYGNHNQCHQSATKHDCEGGVVIVPQISMPICQWETASSSCRYKDTWTTASGSVINLFLLVMVLHCSQTVITRLMLFLYHHAKLRIKEGLCACCYEPEALKRMRNPKVLDFQNLESQVEQKEDEVQEWDGSMEDQDLEAMEEYGDELKLIQARKTTLIRGVCYAIMKKRLDYISTQQEVQLMLGNKAHKWTWITLPPRTLRDTGREYGFNWTKALIYRLRSAYYSWYWFGDPVSCGRIVAHGHIFNRGLLVRVLQTNRNRANAIRGELVKLETELEQDIFLMQQFLFNSLIGVQRKVVEWLLYQQGQVVSVRPDRLGLQFLALLVYPLYHLVCLVVAVYYGMQIDLRSTPLFVSAFVIVVIEEFLLLQPFHIWWRHVWVPSIARVEYTALQIVVSHRAKTILKRSAGLVRNINSVIQHYHPACRVARLAPQLCSSRLLMSLTDYDLPVAQLIYQMRPPFIAGKVLWFDGRTPLVYDCSATIKNNAVIVWDICFNAVSTSMYWTACLYVYCLLCLPQWLQYVITEWSLAVWFNMLIIGLYLSLQVSAILTALASVVAFVLAAVIIYRHLYIPPKGGEPYVGGTPIRPKRKYKGTNAVKPRPAWGAGNRSLFSGS